MSELRESGSVPLKDWVEGNCEYEGCYENNSGYCAREDPGFLKERIKDLIENKPTSDYVFECKFEVPEGSCIYCGAELEPKMELLGEYWGAPAYKTWWECPNGH